MKTKILKSIVALFVFVISISVITMTGCMDYASRYSEEKHKERISKLVKKRYMTEESEYTSFEVYPLYNEYDELKFFVVEFEPYGYVYVKINEQSISLFGASMYTRSTDGLELWCKRKIVEGEKACYTDENGNLIWFNNSCWLEIQDDGEPVKYKDSPYKVSGIENEKRYLLQVKNENGYVPAVRRSDKFLNLISLEEWLYVPINELDGEESNSTTPQPIDIIGFMSKPYFDL